MITSYSQNILLFIIDIYYNIIFFLISIIHTCSLSRLLLYYYYRQEYNGGMMIYKIHKSDMEMSQNSFRKHFLLENSITRMT